jgi:hypothetical protein
MDALSARQSKPHLAGWHSGIDGLHENTLSSVICVNMPNTSPVVSLPNFPFSRSFVPASPQAWSERGRLGGLSAGRRPESSTMSEVFDGYERQYCEISASLSRKCNAASSLQGGMISPTIIPRSSYPIPKGNHRNISNLSEVIDLRLRSGYRPWRLVLDPPFRSRFRLPSPPPPAATVVGGGREGGLE